MRLYIQTMGHETHTTVQRAIAGNADALETLWREHRHWLAIVALSHTPRDTDLEDVMQDIAVAIIKDIHRVRDPQAIRGWLRGVAINVSTSAGRKSTRRRAALNGLAARLSRSEPREHHRADDDLRALHALIASLPEMYREPLLLSAWRGMTHAQIGELLSLPTATVETRIRRARRLIREMASPKLAQAIAPS